MAAIQGRVVEVRPDDCRYVDPISYKYNRAPSPNRGPWLTSDDSFPAIAVEEEE